MASTPVLNPKITAAGNALLPTDTQPGLSATLTHVAIGTGLYDPVVDANGRATQTALVNEVARYAISSGSKPDNYSVQIGTTITDTDMNGASPNGKSIGEIGFYAGTTLFAVWSRATGGALFIKSENLDVPFAYTLDVSVLPVGSVNITVSTDTAGMAALILQHEAKLDPHPGYVLKKRGMGEYDPLTIYNAGAHIVGPDGKTYRSLVDNNVGNTPASYPAKWERWAFSTGELAAEFVPVRTGVQANGSNTLGMVRITNPDAAYFASDSNPLTGAFKIVLPTGAYNALVRMRVEIHESATGKSITLLIAGYASGINWSNQTVAILGERADRDLAVRFGNDGSKPIVWIGELTSTWSFPRVYVSEVMVSYNADGGSVARWMAGWSISAVTVFNSVTATMTGNLVFGQSDIPRVAGLQAALDLKAPLDSAQMTGTPSITNTPTATTAQLALKGASGALNNEGKLRLYGTFGTGSSDTGTRLIASLRAGFNAGSWGKEYLNFWINNGSSNDGQSDASQQLVMSLVSGGRVLVNASSDDGSTALQVNGSVRAANYNINSQSVGDSGIFGFTNANGPAVAAYGSGTSGAGALVLRTAGAERARVSSGGRLLIGTTTDDGSNLLQVAGNVSLVGAGPTINFNNGGPAIWSPASKTLAFTNGNGEVARLTSGGRVLIGTTSDDGSSLLQVAGNTYFYGVSYFGQTSSKAWINADANAYYLYGQGNALVGSAGSSGYLGLVSANAERLRVTASGRILIGTTADNGGDLLQVAGTVRGINGVGALIAANGGGTGQTSIILSRDGGPADQKKWEVMHGGDGTFSIRTVNDAYSAAQNALWVTRGTGSTVGNMVLLQNGGRVLVGTLADDGANMLQVAGTGMFANNVSAYSSANDTQFTLSASNYAGGISLEAYNKANTTKKNIALAPWGGRVQVGSIPDDGSSLLQVGGNGRFSGEVQSTAGIQFRAVFGNYASMLRNDGTNVYLLQTASGDQYGSWNAFRPFSWGLSDGAVRIDQTGAGTTFAEMQPSPVPRSP